MHQNWKPFLTCSHPCHREQITYHLIPFSFALFILNCQFLYTPYTWPSWHQSSHSHAGSIYYSLDRQLFKGRTDTNQWCEAPHGEWELSFLQVPSPKFFQLISLHRAATVLGGWRRHQIGQMAMPSLLVAVVASCSVSYCFVSWPDVSHKGFWFGWLCNPSVHLWVMNLLFCINVSYFLVKLGRLSSWKSGLKLKGNVLVQDSQLFLRYWEPKKYWLKNYLCFNVL